ncbi:MAG: hypothetical protein MT490_07565, partial [Sphingomonas sp.]|uniref:beta strand repeat-containing protein n=1 Tax=Sphingomonas sp. TaxID=28214 RepID=UPI0022743D2A
MLGSALLPMAMASAAHAQTGETVVLEEGRTPTPVALGTGDDRLVVDISRVNGDTGVLDLSGLVTGPVTNAGGNDTTWLRATGTTAHDVVYQGQRSNPATRQYVTADGAPFSGGTVYEASGNDTALTLRNTSRSTRTPPTSEYTSLRFGPLRLAGDGKIVIDFSLGAGDQPDGAQQAIYVEGETSTASGDARLDLEIQGSVGGGAVGAGGLVDVSNASSMRLMGTQLRYGSGVGIKGGGAHIVIEANSWVGSDDESATTLIESSGRVTNKARMSIGGQSGGGLSSGVGVTLQDGQLYNIFEENKDGNDIVSGGLGRIYGSGAAVHAQGEVNYIENAGLLSATTGPTIYNTGETLVTRNVITKFKVSGSQTGEIVGGMEGGDRIAYRSLHIGTDVLVNSGKITGDVLLGSGHGMFLYTEADNGVTGAIGGEDGVDGYGKSFSASATHNLNNNILNQGNNSGFEMHGIEASGANTMVTVAAAGDPLDAGLMLVGDGSVVNTANITTDGYGVWSRQIRGIAEGMDFINRGAITSRLDYGVWGKNLSSFLNESDIRSQGRVAVQIDNGDMARGPTFKFTNTGLIETSSRRDSGAVLWFHNQATEELLADIVNSGTIRHTGDIRRTEDDEQYAFSAETRLQRELGKNYRMHAVNSGTIEATGRGFSGLEMRGSNIELVNGSIIRGTNAAGGGVRLAAGNDGLAPRGMATLTNRGTISGGSGAIGDSEFLRIGYGVLFDFARPANGGEGSLVNEGAIEVGAEGVAVGVDGGQNTTSAFTLVNRGTIRGGAGYTLVDDAYLLTAQLLADGARTIAGAIHTNNSVDSITNRGSIIGSVDLGDHDDIFRNYGRLDGDVLMGGGVNAFVVGSGSVINGTIDGGALRSRIEVDLTGSDDKRINLSQFKKFDSLTTLAGSAGAGRVSIFGDTDRIWMRLNNLTVYIDQGDTVRSASGATGDTLAGNIDISTQEIVNNAGTIEGGVSLGAGDDVLNNSGTVGFDVNLGFGNDAVTNSGTVNGDVDLGAGNDRYEARGGGIVTGSIDGGDGTDTFVFRLNGNSGSIPGGFTNFESFGAYGPGTLSLALNQSYDTIELYENANLTLADGTGTVGRITGDDSAQTVTISDADFAGGVSLAGGDDTLGLQLNGRLTGALDGGDGTDTLKLNLTGASSINDLFNFEIVDVAGVSPLTLMGTLGAGQRINFDGSDNRFIVDTGAVFQGSANGGDGTDTLEINTGAAHSRTIVAGQVTSFEKLVAGGAGTLALDGEAYRFESVEVEGNLSIGDGASLASANGVNFGGGDNRLTLEGNGTVTSPVDGGDG